MQTLIADAEGRVTLPISFANATVFVEQLSETELRIRKSVAETESEWLPELEQRHLSDAARDRFLELLANPPPPNEALKAAMAERRERLRSDS